MANLVNFNMCDWEKCYQSETTNMPNRERFAAQNGT